jgi:hypothetical protein
MELRAERNSTDSLAAQLGLSHRGPRSRGNQTSFEFTDRIEDAARENSGRIVRLGSFPGRADDSASLFRDGSFDEHREKGIASNAISFGDEEHVAPLEGVERIGQSAPMFDAEAAGEPGVGVDRRQFEAEPRRRLFDLCLLTS